MTNKEAFEILRDTPIDIRSTREDDIHTLYATAQNMALDALEYQIPKKVDDDGEFGRCSACGYVFNSELLNEYGITFCPVCGQKIDWSV